MALSFKFNVMVNLKYLSLGQRPDDQQVTTIARIFISSDFLIWIPHLLFIN